MRLRDGSVSAWDIPTKDGRVGMPDYEWWRPMYPCSAFGPSIVDGSIDESSYIQCHDPETPEWWARRWRWSLSGRAVQDGMEDLPATPGVVEGTYFVFGKRS